MRRISESSVRGSRIARRKSVTKRRRIDYSDIPALSHTQLAAMRRIGRPPLGDEPRQLIAIRLDANVLRLLKAAAAKRGMPYQSLINDLLARQMKKVG